MGIFLSYRLRYRLLSTYCTSNSLSELHISWMMQLHTSSSDIPKLMLAEATLSFGYSIWAQTSEPRIAEKFTAVGFRLLFSSELVIFTKRIFVAVAQKTSRYSNHCSMLQFCTVSSLKTITIIS